MFLIDRSNPDLVGLSPTDLADFLACRHKTTLEREAVQGERERPDSSDDPFIKLLQQRGQEHERRYVDSLRARGLTVEDLSAARDRSDRADKAARTLEAMRRGVDVIVQAPLFDGTWFGYADVLLKVPGESALGDWHYEAHDTKLARETRAGAILQLCVYTDLLGTLQGRVPDQFRVVTPAATHTYRFADVAAYYRLVKAKLLHWTRPTEPAALRVDVVSRPTEPAALRGLVGRPDLSAADLSAPDPVDHCSLCRWWEHCNAQRRAADHIQFVAGLGRQHKKELASHGITTKGALAAWQVPAAFKPSHGARETYVRLQDQAALQVLQTTNERPEYRLLDVEPHVDTDGAPLPPRGLRRLPEPSPGDLFLDLEGDPFGRDVIGGESGEGSREYLFGLGRVDESGEFRYRAWWAFDDGEERRAFEEVMDEIARVIQSHPGAHVYHYAPYEPSAFKRLSGRYATRAEALDELLRGGRFVDLYAVVRESIRAGVESYSIKELEPFYEFARDIDLRKAGRERQAIEIAIESGDLGAITADIRSAVEGYNRDDVRSTWALRAWLEARRDEAIARGDEVPRPVPESGAPSEQVGEREQRVEELRARLLQLAATRPDSPPLAATGPDSPPLAATGRDWPPLAATRSDSPPLAATGRHSLQLAAYLLDWHRRENKSEWWEFFRLVELDDEALLEERKAVSGLRFLDAAPFISEKTGRATGSMVERYAYPLQDCDVKTADNLNLTDGKVWGEVVDIDRLHRIITVKVGRTRAGVRPSAAFAHEVVSAPKIEDALYEIGSALAEDTASPLAVALLRADAPPTRDVVQLRDGVLAVQGPPGTGKTYSGGVMICDLVAAGKSVGVTALSHAAIANLLKAVRKEAAKRGMDVPLLHVKNEDEFGDDNPKVVGGTAWHWCKEYVGRSPQKSVGRPALGAADDDRLDVLFVDEAGQMSLANTLACTVATKALVLLGDPQQLEQPTKGVHPDGVGGSALQHYLAGHKTMPPERGEFLPVTRRLAPRICDFTSELFYEGRLTSLPGLERQVLTGAARFSGSGLRVVPVEHDGNRNASDEEVAEVVRIVDDLLAPGSCWVDEHGVQHQLTPDDIRIVAPYNAHVARLQEALTAGSAAGASSARSAARSVGRDQIPVGTVDKFQGQEAAVVIYSMATSRPEDAPRGLGFLYSLNRFNVATSRARCLCIVVASPLLFEPDCQSPAHMQLANALCRYRELAGNS